MSELDRTKWARQRPIGATPKISSSITSRGTNHSEGSRGNSRVAPTTDSLAGGAPIAPASPSPEREERSPSQEWRQRLALLWQILSGPGFPNQFFCDSWVVGFWRADHGWQDIGLE